MNGNDIPEEIPDAASEPLDNSETIEEMLYDMTVLFNQTFKQAPALSRPLPAGYVTVKEPPKFVSFESNFLDLTFIISPHVYDSAEKMKLNEDYERCQRHLNELENEEQTRNVELQSSLSQNAENSLLRKSIVSTKSDIEQLEKKIEETKEALATAKKNLKEPVGLIRWTYHSMDNKGENENEKENEKKRKKQKYHISPSKSVSTRPIAELTFWECFFYPAPELVKYKYISFEKLKEEMEAAAPGFKLVHSKSASKDRLRLNLLRLTYLKAKEFGDIHSLQHKQIFFWYSLFQNFGSLLTAAVTTALFIWGETDTVVFGASVVAIFVSAIATWIQFKKWETLLTRHNEAAINFRKIAKHIYESAANLSEESARHLKSSHKGDVPVQEFQSKFTLKLNSYADNFTKYLFSCIENFGKCFGIDMGAGDEGMWASMLNTIKSTERLLDAVLGVISVEEELSNREDVNKLELSSETLMKIINLNAPNGDDALTKLIILREEMVTRIVGSMPKEMMEHIVNLPRVVQALKKVCENPALIEGLSNPIELFGSDKLKLMVVSSGSSAKNENDDGSLSDLAIVKEKVIVPLITSLISKLPSSLGKSIDSLLLMLPSRSQDSGSGIDAVSSTENFNILKQIMERGATSSDFRPLYKILISKLFRFSSTNLVVKLVDFCFDIPIKEYNRKFETNIDKSSDFFRIISGALDDMIFFVTQEFARTTYVDDYLDTNTLQFRSDLATQLNEQGMDNHREKVVRIFGEMKASLNALADFFDVADSEFGLDATSLKASFSLLGQDINGCSIDMKEMVTVQFIDPVNALYNMMEELLGIPISVMESIHENGAMRESMLGINAFKDLVNCLSTKSNNMPTEFDTDDLTSAANDIFNYFEIILGDSDGSLKSLLLAFMEVVGKFSYPGGHGSTSYMSQEVDNWCSNLKDWIRIVSELMHTVEDVIHEGSKIRLPTTGANDTGETTATVPYDEILRLVSDATGMNLSVFISLMDDDATAQEILDAILDIYKDGTQAQAHVQAAIENIGSFIGGSDLSTSNNVDSNQKQDSSEAANRAVREQPPKDLFWFFRSVNAVDYDSGEVTGKSGDDEENKHLTAMLNDVLRRVEALQATVSAMRYGLTLVYGFSKQSGGDEADDDNDASTFDIAELIEKQIVSARAKAASGLAGLNPAILLEKIGKQILFASTEGSGVVGEIKSKLKAALVKLGKSYLDDDHISYLDMLVKLVFVFEKNDDEIGDRAAQIKLPFEINDQIRDVADMVMLQLKERSNNKSSTGGDSEGDTIHFEAMLKPAVIEEYAVSTVKQLLEKARSKEGQDMMEQAILQAIPYLKGQLPPQATRAFDIVEVVKKDKKIKALLKKQKDTTGAYKEDAVLNVVYEFIPRIDKGMMASLLVSPKNALKEISAKLECMRQLHPDTIEVLGGKMLFSLIDDIESYASLVSPDILNVVQDPLAALGAVKNLTIQIAEGIDDTETIEPNNNEKLQMLLRRAAEYSLLHELWANTNSKIRDSLAGLTMIVIFATSLALFSGMNNIVGGSLVAFATFLDIVKRGYDANSIMSRNFECQRSYNVFVSDLSYTLMIEDKETQENKFDSYASRFYNIKAAAPFVPPAPFLSIFKEIMGVGRFSKAGPEPIFDVIRFDEFKPSDYVVFIPKRYTRIRKVARTVLQFLETDVKETVLAGAKVARAGVEYATSTVESAAAVDTSDSDMIADVGDTEYGGSGTILREGCHPCSSCFCGSSPTDANATVIPASEESAEIQEARSNSYGDFTDLSTTPAEKPLNLDMDIELINLYQDPEEYEASIDEGKSYDQACELIWEGQVVADPAYDSLYQQARPRKDQSEEPKEGEKYDVDPDFFNDMFLSLKLRDSFDRIISEYTTAVNGMPAVNRPLPEQYYFINMRAILRTTRKYAPTVTERGGRRIGGSTDIIFRDQWSDDVFSLCGKRSERMITMLYDIFSQSMEYRTIHKACAISNRYTMRVVEITCLLLATTITIMLLVAPYDAIVKYIAATMAAVISALVSWTKFRNYETLAAEHEVAFTSFAAIATDVESVFVHLKTLKRYMFGNSRFVLEHLDYLEDEAQNEHLDYLEDEAQNESDISSDSDYESDTSSDSDDESDDDESDTSSDSEERDSSVAYEDAEEQAGEEDADEDAEEQAEEEQAEEDAEEPAGEPAGEEDAEEEAEEEDAGEDAEEQAEEEQAEEEEAEEDTEEQAGEDAEEDAEEDAGEDAEEQAEEEDAEEDAGEPAGEPAAEEDAEEDAEEQVGESTDEDAYEDAEGQVGESTDEDAYEDAEEQAEEEEAEEDAEEQAGEEDAEEPAGEDADEDTEEQAEEEEAEEDAEEPAGEDADEDAEEDSEEQAEEEEAEEDSEEQAGEEDAD